MEKGKEIVPLNKDLYKDLSIEELEERLEFEKIWLCIGYFQCEQVCPNFRCIENETD